MSGTTELEEHKKKSAQGRVETFPTGATRSSEKGKLSYRRALSPIVLRAYVEYLGRHRLQADGHLRGWDNWKQGIPLGRYLDGLGRHDMNVWLLVHGVPAYDENGPVTLKDSLCGVLFNATGMLHELLIDEV